MVAQVIDAAGDHHVQIENKKRADKIGTKAGAKQVEAEAKSELFGLAVDAFGSGSAYNQWVFATGLPKDVQLDLLYAGEGTLWTDLKGFTEVMLGREAVERSTTRPLTPRP